MRTTADGFPQIALRAMNDKLAVPSTKSDVWVFRSAPVYRRHDNLWAVAPVFMLQRVLVLLDSDEQYFRQIARVPRAYASKEEEAKHQDSQDWHDLQV